MKRFYSRKFRKYIILIIAAVVLSWLIGFISPEYENIKSKIAVYEGIPEIKSISDDNLWKTSHFTQKNAFLAVTKIYSTTKIQEIKPSNIGVLAKDIHNNGIFINPIGIVEFKSQLDNNAEYTIGKNGIICFSPVNKYFKILSKHGNAITLQTAGTINTADIINEKNEIMAVGTNAKRLWLVELHGKKFTYQKKRLPGAPVYSCIMDGKLMMLCIQESCIFSWDPINDKTYIINMPANLFENMTITSIANKGFLCTNKDKAIVIDKNGKICFYKLVNEGKSCRYITSASGKYLGISETNIIKGRNKEVQDTLVSCYDLTTGKMKWNYHSLLEDSTLIDILDDGGAICYNAKRNSIFRRSSAAGNQEHIVTLPGPISSIVHKTKTVYILSHGEIWSIREISSY